MALLPFFLQTQNLKLSKSSPSYLITSVSHLDICSLFCIHLSHPSLNILKEAAIFTPKNILTVSVAEVNTLSPRGFSLSQLLAPCSYLSQHSWNHIWCLSFFHISHLIQIFFTLPPKWNLNPSIFLFLQGLGHIISFLSGPLQFGPQLIFLLLLLSLYNPFSAYYPERSFLTMEQVKPFTHWKPSTGLPAHLE